MSNNTKADLKETLTDLYKLIKMSHTIICRGISVDINKSINHGKLLGSIRTIFLKLNLLTLN